MITLPKFVDERGSLVVVHGEKEVPFVIRRIYYIYEANPGTRRGAHAHKNSQQLLVCLKGQCRVVLDDGQQRQSYLLNDPAQGLFVDHCIWLEIDRFSADCLLMVLSSTGYEPSNDIEDYQDFLKCHKTSTEHD